MTGSATRGSAHEESPTAAARSRYFIPQPCHWPLLGCLGLLTFFVGAAHWLHHVWYGPYLLFLGATIIIGMMFGWFGRVIHENQAGLHNDQVDRSFRWGMMWFIYSEIFFFACFFGALFYTRLWSVPELGGEIHPITHILLWPDFTAEWPLMSTPDNREFTGPSSLGNPWRIPALNTLLLLSSGVAVTIAHWGLQKGRRGILIGGLIVTILLGATFLVCQGIEYHAAYTQHGLTLNAGSYGSLFFILTGFHGAHVTIGATILTVVLLRSMAGHFTPEHHFAFQAGTWYWHFVDVVWLMLFVFVYWL